MSYFTYLNTKALMIPPKLASMEIHQNMKEILSDTSQIPNNNRINFVHVHDRHKP